MNYFRVLIISVVINSKISNLGFTAKRCHCPALRGLCFLSAIEHQILVCFAVNFLDGRAKFIQYKIKLPHTFRLIIVLHERLMY